MKDLENNKIFASIVVAGLIALICGKIANGLYHPVKEPEKRGYEVEVAEASSDSAPQEEKKEEPVDIPALMAAATVEGGKKVFKKCAACHSYESGGAHKLGPNLAGIVNAPIASKSDYSYSDALKSMDKPWNYEELYAFLKKPRKYAPGTKMSFAGLKKPEQIADIIKLLESNN
jgi:cytochrome c